MTYIYRDITPRIEDANKVYPIITITGPRQCGKSTLSRHLFPDYRYVNLEQIVNRSMAAADPQGFIEGLGHKAIIDEVQHSPQLLSEIQVKVDEDRSCRYILTGSSNFSLLSNVTQSLAGRTALFTLLPFAFSEIKDLVQIEDINQLIWNGFYPGVICNGISPADFYDNYYNTYVERDLRDLLKVSNLLKFDTFVRMLALRVGSEFNSSSLSREIGVSSVTISEWLSLLVTSYIVFELPPYYHNPSKSLTKSKKIYFYDTGLLCNLLSITNPDMLGSNPLRGAIFENLAVAEIMKKRLLKSNRPNMYFYRENRGVEVDVVIPNGTGSLQLYEIKSSKSLQPDYAANMKKMSATIGVPTQSTVIYNGQSLPPMALNIRDI
ncbi:MAG: ATP-binding protein [Muribaculum sp.]|nr:ATP-binding protein [Muribaculum sp.]